METICASTDADAVCVTIAGVDASIRAPVPALETLTRTLAPALKAARSASIRVAIDVERDEFVWRIKGRSQRSVKVLSAASALPQVAGAIVSSLVADVADVAELAICRAAVVERDGLAVAFVGDDWESGIVLATHLHSRGWRLLGGDYALIERASLRVLAIRKLLYVTLSVLDELPLAYRRAVEASPWYSTPHDIAFYAVDPALAHPAPPWAEAAQLRAVFRLDGSSADFPSLERIDSFVLGDGLDSSALERAGVAIAEVRIGDYATTCDLLQRWFQSLDAG